MRWLSALLVDGKCGSACDSFAAAMKDHRAAKLLGRKTKGHMLSASAFMTSWRGYVVLVPVGLELSPLANVIEGVGVPPDVELAMCDAKTSESQAAGDQCLRAALDLIKQELKQK